MREPDAELTEIFRDEAAQRLDEMDAALLAIESGDAGAEIIDSLFRNAHTIKGAAGMLGFDDVRALAHAAEDVLASVRDGRGVPAGARGAAAARDRRLARADRRQGAPVGALLSDLAASRAAQTVEQATGRAQPGQPRRGQRRSVARGRPAPAEPRRAGGRGPVRAQPRSAAVPPEKIDHCSTSSARPCRTGAGWRMRSARRRAGEGVADALGAGERPLDDLKDAAVGMRTLPLSAIAGPLPRAVRDLARAAGKDAELWSGGGHRARPGDPGGPLRAARAPAPQRHRPRDRVPGGAGAARQAAVRPGELRAEQRGEPRRGRRRRRRPRSLGGAVERRREGSLADVLARPGSRPPARSPRSRAAVSASTPSRSYADSLGGSLEVRSEPGHGTEVILRLPLALALIEVLLFERGRRRVRGPAGEVEEVVMVSETLGSTAGQRWSARELSAGGRPRGAARRAAPPLGDQPPAIVITVHGRQVAVTCDALLGEEEVMVKPLGPLLAGARGLPRCGHPGRRPDRAAARARDAHPESPGVPGPTGPGAAAGPAAAPKILVVEDSFPVRELQRSILEAAGIRGDRA